LCNVDDGIGSSYNFESNQVPDRLFKAIPATYRLINGGGPPQPYNKSHAALQLPLLSDHEVLTNEVQDSELST